MASTDKPLCPTQRISVTDEEIRSGQATCPRCKRKIRIRPNRGLKQATLNEHVSGEENLAKNRATK